MGKRAHHDAEITAKVSAIAAKLNAAIFDRSLFIPALNDFAAFVGTQGASLEQIDLVDNNAVIHGHVGVEDEAFQAYVEYYHTVSPRLSYTMNTPIGVPVSDLHMVPAGGRSRNEFYDWVSGVTDCAYTLGLKLEHTVGRMTVIGLHHTDESALEDRGVKKRLLAFVPMLDQLNLSLKEFDRLQGATPFGLDMMDSLSSGIALLTTDGMIVDANRPMRDILSKAALLASERGCLTSPHGDVAEQIATARQAAAGGTSQNLLLRDPLAGNLVCAFLPSLPRGTADEGDAPRLVLLLVRGQERWDTTVEMLRGLFDLTPRESGVAAGLAQGKSLGQVAQDFTISPETARVHLRNIFAKTGTSRQGELIAMILSITTR